MGSFPGGGRAGGGGDTPRSPPKACVPLARPQRRHGNAGAKGKCGRAKSGWSPLSLACPGVARCFYTKPLRIFLFTQMDLERLRVGEPGLCGSVGSGRVALSVVPCPRPHQPAKAAGPPPPAAMRMRPPPPPEPFCPGTLLFPPVPARPRPRRARL